MQIIRKGKGNTYNLSTYCVLGPRQKLYLC